jgi:predicted pyridoxine 5'-phosphate oxidase superfamily flavin-nucleotide-binding protein
LDTGYSRPTRKSSSDTFTNVLQNPKVGLIFLVPGKSETLRVSGSAKIVRDADVRESMAARGKTPDFALAVELEEAFFHCSKCMIRSSLWRAEAWPSLDGLPSLAQTMVDAAALPMPVEALEDGYPFGTKSISTTTRLLAN